MSTACNVARSDLASERSYQPFPVFYCSISYIKTPIAICFFQARRMDSGEGVCFIFWEVFLAPEALTRVPKAQASRGVFVHALPENFANLGSLKCHFLHFDIISEVGCIFLQY